MKFVVPRFQSRRERWAGYLLGSAVVFNVVDAILTTAVVGAGLAVEANPLMAAALSRGPAVFLLIKLLIGGAGAWVLWRFRRHRLAVFGIAVVFAVYALVIAHQVRSLELLVAMMQTQGARG